MFNGELVKVKADANFFDACLFDFCETDGDDDMAHNVVVEEVKASCCSEATAKCIACNADITIPEFCKQRPEVEGCPRVCASPATPFKTCAAWGDPHYTASFHGKRFNFQGKGLLGAHLASEVLHKSFIFRRN